VQELISFNKANPKDALTPGTPLLIPAKSQPVQEAQLQLKPQAQPQVQAQPQPQAVNPELNPSPRYKIIRRSGS